MRYLILSDTHLTHRFEPKKMAYLSRMIEPADRVILNGDFWEQEKTTFDQFLASEWATTLFPLLRQKNTVYLFGNHDPEDQSDDRVEQFAIETADLHRCTIGSTLYHFEHGHRFLPLDELGFIPDALAGPIHDTLIGLFSPRIMNLTLSHLNRQLRTKARQLIDPDAFLLTGHTHVPELSNELRYGNSGFVLAGYGGAITIDQSNGAALSIQRW